jgi:phosphopantetheinyl transferase
MSVIIAAMEVFCTDISAADAEACYPLLGEDERLRLGGLTGKMKTRFLVSRAFRRRVLGPDAEILTDENGRPFVKGDPVFFSMSHSGNLLVIAVDDSPIGIDVEFMKKRDFARLSAWFFGEPIPGRDDFYRHWTRFEAGLKLAGLPLFSKAVPEPGHLHSETMGDYMLSVASHGSISLPLSIVAL